MPEASRSSAEIAALEARLAALERELAELRAAGAKIMPGERLKLLGPLAGGLAHDFNNLLMIILGNAEIGLMDAAPQSPTEASLEQIRTAALRAAEFCRKMLAYAGRARLELRPANLSSLVSSLRDDLRAAVDTNVALECELDGELPGVEVDASQVKQLLMNLVSNAVEALAGAIVVRTGVMAADQSYLSGLIADRELPSGPYVFLEVADNGHGMNEDTAARICDPLFSTRGKTRGLGMTVAIGIVRAHHGALRVESALGRGATIRVLFPPAASVGHDFRIAPASCQLGAATPRR